MAQGAPILTPATPLHLLEMMAWFPTSDSIRLWGGSAFRFPFDESTFTADTKLAELPSYALISLSGMLCGFGQYYLRQGRCHLGRLVVSPAARRQGFGARLIELLTDMGTRALGVRECSLFVDVRNAAAIALYERLGFVRAAYPGDDVTTGDWYYMVRHLE